MKSTVSRVHIVFKTHLDLGFTDYARNIVRRYLDDYIPAALDLAQRTRERPERFVWTMGSWLVHEFMGKASRTNRHRMEEAIRAGDIHWHALPFTTHTELMDASVFRHGLLYARGLDLRFGRKTRAAKMTDVPGHTRAIVPLLAEGGVRLLHLGVNPASTPPNVPSVFLWRSEGREVVVIYENVYGATTVLPGNMALSVNLTGDNLGPQNPDEITKTYDVLRKRFPNARVTAGSLEGVADWLWHRRRSLPIITAEIGDTWIHGVGTDPAKVSRFRALSRLRSQWILSGKLKEGGAADFRLAESLLLTAEHTWGMDIKTHLRDWKAYSPKALRRALAKPQFKAVVSSWDEQRRYITDALLALPPRLAEEVRHEFARVQVSKAKRTGSSLSLTDAFRLGRWSVGLHPDGSIERLACEGERMVFTDSRHRLGAFAYQVFSPDDYRRYYRQYNQLDVEWARGDFTKPGLPTPKASGWHRPRLVALERRPGDEVRAHLRFPVQAVRCGAPAESLLSFRDHPGGIDLRLEWTGKAANRMPEAFWLAFRPRSAPGATWRFEKMGVPIDPLDVIRNGNKHLHAVTGPASLGRFSVYSQDAPLLAPGRPGLLDFNNRQPDLKAGVSFNLYNNVWGTNFPMWYSEDAVFRFQLRWADPG
ncbi:MAG TPA: DUF5054 domain-containing protein [Candidatus Methylacidiphilales bacterium]